jgi:hypothetical protein
MKNVHRRAGAKSWPVIGPFDRHVEFGGPRVRGTKKRDIRND